MKTPVIQLLLLLTIAVLFSCSKQREDHVEGLGSLSDLKLDGELEVTLFGSEPMFSNPTNMDIDSRGRVWITEAYNYRNQYNPGNPVRKEGDRIIILEDTDGDGNADESKVFYQGTEINAALGILVLGKKVIVSCSPNVFVFTDEDGDDKADKKEVLFQGIQGHQHDHAVHSFTFGHDGKLYFTMGNEGVVLVDARGDTVRDIHGRQVNTRKGFYRDGLALRCDLDGSNVEVIGHNFRNNYELAVDPYGTVWQSDNDDDGNKGTRINYVMEHGNFGYKDEMSGASWTSRRTNMEKEIPLRHWHLNDPGVVPNVRQNGSGSPTGILVYEGELLPSKYYGQLIHAEPGHNVVRTYPLEIDGAGYKASVEPIVQAEKDQWFRPSDVAVAPDGSLFIADWYDPGVGGHQVGDVNKGRVYRVGRRDDTYTFSKADLTTPEGAVESLHSPNVATRYLAWTALREMGERSENALLKSWKSSNARHRAQALWLLAQLPGGGKYIGEAITDADANIRITGIRVNRMVKGDIITICKRLVNDPSPQVRRELAISLYGLDATEAAQLWTELALQYDGKDRWYLEALGIGAAVNWDLYFETWLKKTGPEWKNARNSDIVWRSRSKHALPLLAELIGAADEASMMRYFRAFDFHTDPSRQTVLSNLITTSSGDKVLYSLKHMDARNFAMTPAVTKALNKVLAEKKDQLEYVELASRFRLEEKANELLRISITYPDSAMGKEAMKTLLDWNKTDLVARSIEYSSKEQRQAIIKAVWPHMYDSKAIALMEGIMLDDKADLELRKLAVKTFGGPWESEDHLLGMAKDKRIPEPLHAAAAGVFQTAWRATLRDEAAKYLQLPGSKEGTSLPAISVLVSQQGEKARGKDVYKRVCSSCHQINKEGVNFGPDLSEIGSKLSKEAIYTSILYPDQGISFGYEGYRFKLKDGSSAFGRILSETEDQLEVQYMQQQQMIRKENIVSRVKLENSLMPSGLQSSLAQQELVDLVEYLQGLGR